MTGRKKTYIVDDFIVKLRSHTALQGGPWPQRIDDLEAVLRGLFVSGDERALPFDYKMELRKEIL